MHWLKFDYYDSLLEGLSLDEGQFDGRADIWLLGIIGIELCRSCGVVDKSLSL